MLDWQRSLILWPKRFNTKKTQIPHVFWWPSKNKKKSHLGIFRIFFGREQPWASDGSRHLRMWFKVFHFISCRRSKKKASSGNQNLGTPSCKWKKWSNIWFHQTKFHTKTRVTKNYGIPNLPKLFQMGKPFFGVTVCFLDGKSSSKGTGTHLLWSSSGYSERSSVATCQLSNWWEWRPSHTYCAIETGPPFS